MRSLRRSRRHKVKSYTGKVVDPDGEEWSMTYQHFWTPDSFSGASCSSYSFVSDSFYIRSIVRNDVIIPTHTPFSERFKMYAVLRVLNDGDDT